MTETSLMILEHDKALGKIFVESGFFADAKKESEAIVKILAGREVGLKPIEAMTGIHIIKGKITFGANMMAAAVKKSGHYDYKVTTHTATECVIDFLENKGAKWEIIGTSSFTIDEAKQIGLTSNTTWKNYPKAMLFARALSAGVRYYCPDVFGHSPVYVPEEMGANVDEDGDVIDITPKESPKKAEKSQHYDPETRDNPHEMPVKEAETPELQVIPNNPMPYTKKKVMPQIATETASNALQIPERTLKKMRISSIDDAMGILTEIALSTEQSGELKKIVLKHCPEYFDMADRTDVSESILAQIIKEASGVEMKED